MLALRTSYTSSQELVAIGGDFHRGTALYPEKAVLPRGTIMLDVLGLGFIRMANFSTGTYLSENKTPQDLSRGILFYFQT